MSSNVIGLPHRRLLTTSEAAELLRLTERRVRQKAHEGELPCLQLGGPGSALRFDADELNAWLNSPAVGASRARTPDERSAPGNLLSPAVEAQPLAGEDE
jgi:excisionase family DNA binding protein